MKMRFLLWLGRWGKELRKKRFRQHTFFFFFIPKGPVGTEMHGVHLATGHRTLISANGITARSKRAV